MMQQRMPKTFYLKILFILTVLGYGWWIHTDVLHEIWQEEATFIHKVGQTLVIYMGGNPVTPSSVIPMTEEVTTHEFPRHLSAEVLMHSHYQQSSEIARLFNEALDMDVLNQYFVETINAELGMNIQYAPELLNGTTEHVAQLSMYHYLSPQTATGERFTTLFPEISGSDYRLSEWLYEVHLSAQDVHLSTWQTHPDVLATYLTKHFASQLAGHFVNRLALSVALAPSDYQIEYNPYTRLIVAVVSDTPQ